ncbi:MAG TPA: H-type lectin domain-containing protein [Actinomycetota bacterium]|nr:H-type lectin domain-containing protein [Actinomycetota bacterium]
MESQLMVLMGYVSGNHGQPDWTLDDPQVGQRTVIRSVTFPKPFPQVPGVLVNLRGLDAAAGKNLRVRVYAADITPTAFNVKFETWADSIIYEVRASWIAITMPVML